MQAPRYTLMAMSLFFCSTLALAEDKKDEKAAPEEDSALTIKGTPPADHPFAKLKLGMKFSAAVDILGKPSAERAYCTGKQHIPFYMGPDKGRTEYFYKGQGKVIFYTRVSTFTVFHVTSCSAKEPFEIAGVEYNPNESGEAPKE